MFGLPDLKPRIALTASTVECPVRGCKKTVARARRGDRLLQEQFLCSNHAIYISPSTFEYRNRWDNFLRQDEEDHRLLDAIWKVKRECRMAREKSEDAVTWNIFRFMESSGLLAGYLASIVGSPVIDPSVIYWSYCARTEGVCAHLREARREFGENPQRSSEPDLVVESQGKLFWIETKLTSTNLTTPSNPQEQRRYPTGGSRWFEKVFRTDYSQIAVEAKRYELMRLWLLGTWAAHRRGEDFYLLNILRSGSKNEAFPQLIREDSKRRFCVSSWEAIYQFVAGRAEVDAATRSVLRYFESKSAGYSAGCLKAAFPELQRGLLSH